MAALASSDDQDTRAKLSLALVQKASAHKARVQRYLEYHLDDQPIAKRELDGIRVGTGYLDLESDLRRLAVLISAHATLVATDRAHAASDSDECFKLAVLASGGTHPPPCPPCLPGDARDLGRAYRISVAPRIRCCVIWSSMSPPPCCECR